MAFKHLTWHHGYNTQHGVLTPHVTPCLQRSKKFEPPASCLFDKGEGLRLGVWTGSDILPDPFRWSDRPVHVFGV